MHWVVKKRGHNWYFRGLAAVTALSDAGQFDSPIAARKFAKRHDGRVVRVRDAADLREERVRLRAALEDIAGATEEIAGSDLDEWDPAELHSILRHVAEVADTAPKGAKSK